MLDALTFPLKESAVAPVRLAMPIGVCVLPEPLPNRARTTNYPAYVHEILGHAGVCYASVPFEELDARLDELKVLVTVGEVEFPAELRGQITNWVKAGGVWLSLSGVCGMAELFGVEMIPPAFKGWGAGAMSTLGEGYLQVEQAGHPVIHHLSAPLHFFSGIAVQSKAPIASALDAHGRSISRAAIVENQVEKGRCLLLAPDVTGTIVRIQQGTAVSRDGVNSPDGLGTCADGVLKSDDGMALDWIFDRDVVPGVPGFEAFLRPVADQWREIVLRAVFYLAHLQGLALPLLWFYPRNLPAIGHISHDTDGNNPQLGRLLLEALERAEIQSTWCMICPGYDGEFIGEIRGAGHELAMHFDTMTPGLLFSQTEFEKQWKQLCALFGEAPVTNKNHYLRWEGDTEFFEWCERFGIEMDQTKGASKTGEAGFNFGTCHPYFPVRPDGCALDVLELPTPTQDLCVFAPVELLQPLLEAAHAHYGVLHLLFHPSHIEKPGVADAIVAAARQARERGMEWWTARQINSWERARRAATWTSYESHQATLQIATALPGATILWLQSAPNAKSSPTIQRWGFTWDVVSLDATQPGLYNISNGENQL